MNGIRGLLGFHYWVDNSKSAPIEAMLQGRSRISEERREIMRDLEREQYKNNNKNGKAWLKKLLAK
ncbi:MAG: hypothetical protein GVY26_12515 [Bacteroidetes bacterium]|jgi:hypothetical protein|nr:hypothetical protein [Bacteroidota bacterium]